MALFSATQVVAIDQLNGVPLYYAVLQGTYNREWLRYFNSQPIAYGATRINSIDNGPGINQYTLSVLVTNFLPGSLPYLQGVTQTWDVQKYNLETSFQKVASNLLFIDPFGQYPSLDPQTGIIFWKFEEVLLLQSTPEQPYIQYNITLTESPPGITPA